MKTVVTRTITVETSAEITDRRHCSTNCEYLLVRDAMAANFSHQQEGRCTLFKQPLKRDTKRQQHPWRRCGSCIVNTAEEDK